MNRESKILDGIRILSTDPDRRIGVYAIRFLAQAGAKVDSIGIKSQKIDPMGFYSKYLHGKVYFDEGNYRSQFRSFLKTHSNNYDIINPIDVSKMIDVMVIDEELNLKLKYLLPSKEHLIISDNKESIMEHAEKIGIPCPRTYTRVEVEDLSDPAKLGITFPCIIKFRGDSRMTHWRPEERYRIVHERKDLIKAYLEMHTIEQYPVIQEYIEGVGVGFFALYDKENRLKAQFCHQRIREYPITGGPSSCCESIFDDRLISLGRTLLESLEWMGLAMVEFKYDTKRDKFFLLEVNPRYWGSLPLAVYSGVNFPVLHIMSIMGIDFQPILKYRCGIKMRFIEKDIKAIIMSLRKEMPWLDKVSLIGDLFNPYIREGFLTLDDIGLLFKLIRAKL